VTSLSDLFLHRRPAAAAAKSGVVPVHTAVRGRARYDVRGLRGRAGLAHELERRLGSAAGILQVSASPLTGRVLVLFVAERDVEQVAALIAAAIAPAPEAAAHPVRPGLPAALSRALVPWHRMLGRVAITPATAAPRSPGASPPWHTCDAQALLERFATSRSHGLEAALARRLLAAHGPNALPSPQPRSSAEILLAQFGSLPTALLGASAVLSLATGGAADAVVVMGVVLLNAGIGFVTEREAERTIATLAGSAPRTALLIRDGTLGEVDAEAVVPGDLLVLQPGRHVAADARLLECRELTIDESMLTGESVPVRKAGDTLREAALALADRSNMAYLGTIVTGGSGLGVVVATGARTEVGAIQAMVGQARAPQTPMQRQLERLGTQMVWLSLGICGAVFGIGLLRGYGLVQMLRTAVSLAVASVPEGLPTVATTTLALGIRAMRRRNVLVRRLDAVETLGAVQVICMDKTGTLTVNRMSVLALHAGLERLQVSAGRLLGARGEIDAGAREDVLRLLHIAALCSEVRIDGAGRALVLNGSATEIALVELALACGVDVPALRARHPRLDVHYRADGRNWMGTVHALGEGSTGRLLAVKGSPAEVLALCRWVLRGDARIELDEDRRAAILRENERMAGEALRVLGVAYALRTPADAAAATPGFQDGDLVWVGLAGMADPIRAGVRELIALFHQAGIRTVMITGDQSGTAQAIGRTLELSGEPHIETLDSAELARIEPALLCALAEKVQVFSRVSPAHKLEIVQALQRAGRVVAMTGDGVNDSPALKAADIGVAMGRSGTEVARSVADVVLEDDELATMIVAVSEGRTIYDNIRKAVHFLTATNLSEISVMLVATAAGLGTPLSALQLLWINLLTDVAPALALAVEPAEPDVLQRPPRDPQQPIIGRAQLLRYGLESAAIAAGTMLAYGYGWLRYGPGPRSGSLAFNALTLAQLLHAYSCRSSRFGVFRRGGQRPNRRLDLAVGGSALLQAATVLPPLRGLLGTASPAPLDLAVVAAGAGLPFLINEAGKRFVPAGRPPRSVR
jgi:Ca2+-transporting ATPase